MELPNLYWPPTPPSLSSPMAQKQHLPFTKKSTSASTTATQKEGGAGEALTSFKVLMVTSSACAGDRAVAIAATTSSITDAEGWTWEPFLGYSTKHANTM